MEIHYGNRLNIGFSLFLKLVLMGNLILSVNNIQLWFPYVNKIQF